MTGRLYKSVVLISFLILIFVQLKLIYNTYTLRDRDFNAQEKKLLNDEYGRSIPNDKVYKGGGKIVDSVLSVYMPQLRQAYLNDRNRFNSLSAEAAFGMVRRLRIESTMDSVFQSIVRRNHLDTTLHYLLTVQSVDINFDPAVGDVNIFSKYPYGTVIDGSLPTPTLENRVTNLSVSGTLAYDFRITFNFFADYPNRKLRVARQMLPTFSLVALCIIIIVGINYYTYISWMRQKKEAEMKTDFLNSIKHEFNTPVTTIMVAGKSLDEEEILNDKERIRALGQIIGRQARRLQAHINQMLEVSRLKEKVHFESADLNHALLMLIEDYKIKLPGSDLLTFEPYPAGLILSIEPFVFSTMMNNLLDNAFKHNDSAVKRVEVFLNETGSHFVLNIQDNGKGIKEEARVKIFDKFFRLNHDHKTPGLGLGLYYVKQCLDIHGWRMKVGGTDTQGTLFSILIPKYLVKVGTPVNDHSKYANEL
ncbi:HAMP domain-containing sensor histidine kinase [Pedobacter sp. JY14-1]|uniref:sensor histidine kinase n=1 Tax=Pedobacter sp. JY14-1 TaxID=3034151 RepID=UPI0023E2E6E3|nr:HAMP domain-containing sensor histidine kinase [Pedobacter sp. JY14-1]